MTPKQIGAAVRKPGRPRKADPRRNRTTVSYTDAEWKALEKLAKGKPMSEFIRERSLS